jgi:hypothetical protein
MHRPTAEDKATLICPSYVDGTDTDHYTLFGLETIMERLEGGIRYDLGRDFLGSARLNLQHYLWKDTLNYDIHPSIPVAHDHLRIADVGTGTG